MGYKDLKNFTNPHSRGQWIPNWNLDIVERTLDHLLPSESELGSKLLLNNRYSQVHDL